MDKRYVAVAKSDIGIIKEVNQDSILIKHATYGGNEILMAVICDGMGGLSKGEVASAAVIHEFNEWFNNELLQELEKIDMFIIGSKWALLLKDLNVRIQEYGQQSAEKLGTTFTGIIFINDKFVSVHVGDTRLYHIDKNVNQLTNDHTYVAREVLNGNLTPEQAETDKRRNILLQCVGASKKVDPDIICGEVKEGTYMLCSDGFRHEITEQEILEEFNLKSIKSKQLMAKKIDKLIDVVKQRKEKDNISVVLIKVSSEKNKVLMNIRRLLHRIGYKRIKAVWIALLLVSTMMLVCGILFMK